MNYQTLLITCPEFLIKNTNHPWKQKKKSKCDFIGFRNNRLNCNLKYKVPKEIPVVFHNGSTYDYHFVIKQLPEGFNGQLECLGENKEKYITFSVPIKKNMIMVKQIHSN